MKEAGKLRFLRVGNKVRIPKEDIERMVKWAVDEKSNPDAVDLVKLVRRVDSLEKQLEVLKLGLGFGGRVTRLSIIEVELLQKKFEDLLSKNSWTNKEISESAEDVLTLQEDEIRPLLTEKGVRVWIPFYKLMERMIDFVERSTNYPGNGLGVLSARLRRSKDRLLGMIQVVSGGFQDRRFESINEILKMSGPLDQYLIDYCVRAPEKD